MSNPLSIIAGILSAYFLGAIPTSFIFSKALKGIDIRQVGSGNVGATNVFRAVGKLPALFVLLIDISKGVVAATLIAKYFYSSNDIFDYISYRALLGYIAICGHVWPVFLGFRGGKGVATIIGATITLAPFVFALSGIAWLIVFFLTNYVSLASIAMAVSLAISAPILNQPFPIIIFTIAACGLSVYKHKDNITRLVRGEERKTFILKKIKS